MGWMVVGLAVSGAIENSKWAAIFLANIILLLLFAAVLGSIEFLRYYQAWPFIPQ